MGKWNLKFDFVTLEIPCPKCKKPLKDFQTKSTSYPMGARVGFKKVKNFYGYCAECYTWVEFTLKEGFKKGESLDDYDMITKDCNPENVK